MILTLHACDPFNASEYLFYALLTSSPLREATVR
jgi:hypothetical protein